MSLERLKPVLIDLKRLDANLIMLSGGEPLLHPELIDILRFMREIGLKAALNTNGILLENKISVIANLVDYIIISLDARLYKEIRGTDKFDTVINNIRRIKNLYPEIKLEIRTTLLRKNIFDLLDIIRLAEDLKIDGIGLSPADYDSYSFGRERIESEKSMELLIPSLEELDKFEKLLDCKVIQDSFKRGLLNWNVQNFKRLVRFYRDIRNQTFDVTENQLCFFPYTSLLIDYGGELKNCFYSKPFATIDNYTIEQIRNQQSLIELESQKICFKCRGRIFT